MGAARDVAVSEHRAFALGSDGGWVPSSAGEYRGLVRASSRAAAAAAAADLDVGDATEGERAKMLTGVPRREAVGEASCRGAGEDYRRRRTGRRLRRDDGARDDTLGARELERESRRGVGVRGVGASGRRGRRGVRGLARGRIFRRRRRRRTPSGSHANARAEKSKKGDKRAKSKRIVGRVVETEDFENPDSTPPGDGRGHNHRGKRDARARG